MLLQIPVSVPAISLSPRQPGSLSSYTPTLWIVNVTHTMKPGEFPSVAGARTQADLEENLNGTCKEQNPAKRQIPCLTCGNIFG